MNAYDQTIRNVASPELSDDAATKNYVDSEISKTKEYIVDKMVVPSQESPGYAANADYAIKASDSEWASNAINANYASNAGSAESAN